MDIPSRLRLVFVCVLLGACTAAPTPQPLAVARIGYGGSPDTLNPGTAVLTEAYTMFALVYDSMYTYNLDGTYSLSLAESVDRSADGLSYTYKIRSGIKFHDGQPLTARDVAFTYNLNKAHAEYPYMNPYTAYMESITAPDDTTVLIRLNAAIPNIESQLVFQYVLPAHVWQAHADGAAAVEFENETLIGSGPFKLLEYKQGEFVRLGANKQHFSRPPKVDEVIFQTFSNPDALVQAISTGQVDMITELPNTAAEKLGQTQNVKVASAAPFAPAVSDIIFNQATSESCPSEAACNGNVALQDRQVRLALAHATNKQQLIDVVLLGKGTPGLTLIPNGLGMWFNDSLKDYEYDPAKANKILDDAGYLTYEGDIRCAAVDCVYGSPQMNFRMYWPSDSVDAPRMAELLAGMWQEIGVGLQPQAIDPDALTALCCPAFDFDIMLWGWGSDPDPNLLLNVMRTESIATGSSETGYSNARYDALYDQQVVELDQTKRKDLVWEMQRVVHEDVVYIIPYYDMQVQALRTDRFTGWIVDQPKLDLSDVSSLVNITPVK
ncbi:MAG: ABC transporter substrate-binding protein [Chloroflexi bacterium]|nr:MAG: ABC transporter substrate-binding protein [Chloroflexota bacterium]